MNVTEKYFWYGTSRIEVEIPVNSIISSPHVKNEKEESSPESAIIKTLRNPIGTSSLKEIAKYKKRALIIIPDRTRPMPQKKLLPIILNEINKGGIKDNNIKIIIALGTHRPMTKREICKMVGGEVCKRVQIKNHKLKNNLISLGKTENGVTIEVNKEVYNGDLIVGLTSVKPHRGAGWSGGAKLIDPGVCGKKTVDETHYLMAKYPIKEILGNLDNPIRKEMNLVAQKVGLDFTINLVLNNKKEISYISSGDFRKSYRDAVKFADPIFRDPQNEKADFMICGSHNNWAPDFWSAVQAIFSGEYLVKEGGTIVFFAKCPEGFCPSHPQIEDIGYRPIEEIFKLVDDNILTDLAAAGHIVTVSRILKEKEIELILVSENISKKLASRMGFKLINNFQEGVDYIFDGYSKNVRGYLFPGKNVNNTVVIPW